VIYLGYELSINDGPIEQIDGVFILNSVGKKLYPTQRWVLKIWSDSLHNPQKITA
jgi:hypothetical protein